MPPDAASEAAYDGLYPRDRIAGIIILPIVIVSAELDPLVPAKKKQPKIVAVPKPPLVQPTMASLNRTISFAVLPREIISPARMKSGIASKAQLSIALKGTSPNTLTEYTSQSKIRAKDPSPKITNKGTPMARCVSIARMTIKTIIFSNSTASSPVICVRVVTSQTNSVPAE